MKYMKVRKRVDERSLEPNITIRDVGQQIVTHACGKLHTYMHVRIGRGPTPPRKRDREGSNPSRQRDWEGRKPLPTAIQWHQANTM